jgi:hypothetical protein
MDGFLLYDGESELEDNCMDFFLRKITETLCEKDITNTDLFDVDEIFLSLDKDVKERMIAQGETWFDKELPRLPMSLYLEYERNGNRINFEEKYFLRRGALVQTVCAELCENKGRFLPLITDICYEICNETVWWVPAHNKYEDTVTKPRPDTTRPVLALFSAETGAILTAVTFALQDKLSGELLDTVYAKIKNRVYYPYENVFLFWKGVEGRQLNNWGPWCTQSVLISYFLQEKFHENRNSKTTLLTVMHQASWTLDYFISRYGIDGGCDEGPGYFHHAGLCYYVCLLVLNSVTGGAYNGVLEQPKIKNVIKYIWDLNMEGDFYANFGDGGANLVSKDLIKYSFARDTKNEPMTRSFARTWLARNIDEQYALRPIDRKTMFDTILTCKLAKEVKSLDLGDTTGEERHNASYPSIGRYVLRNNGKVVAIAAGSNNESHNHNDCGSFIYTVGHDQIFIDVGAELYTKQTFSKDRYKIWTMQSFYHNLSNFGNNMQMAGEQYRAKVEEVTDDHITMELRDAYEMKDLASYKRAITLGDDGLCVEDTVDCPSTATLSLMVREEPVVKNGKLLLNKGKYELKGSFSMDDVTIEPIPISDRKLRGYLPPTIYRILVAYTDTIRIVV